MGRAETQAALDDLVRRTKRTPWVFPPPTIPYVRIEPPKPQARRSSINRTATPQEHKINITSGNGAYIPELYGPCSPKPHMFAVGMDGNDLIFGLWYGFGEIEEFTEILINDAAVPGAVTVEEHKGTTAQTASTILSNLSGYTHTLVLDVNGTNRGVAYLVFRVPPGAVDGFPKVSVKIKGNCEIEDTRVPVTEYSDLPALCFRHWLKTTGVGPEFSVLDSTFETLADFNEEVPGTAWQASHNYSVGDFATPTGANTKFRIYEVTTDAGSSDAAEPSPWDDTLGNTTVDDGITWTCRDGRRHVCGLAMDVRADIDSWIETWRTACGCMISFGESGVEVIPDKARATDHTFLHASGQILESPPLQLKQTRLKDRPTAVQVIYTNISGEPWRDGTDARAAAAGVDAGTTPERLSVIKAPWIHRKAQAVRLATERLNAASLTDLSFQLHVFDEGLKVKAGDVVETTHPIGLSAKKMRVLDASAMTPGRWVLDLWEYDEAVHSDHVESEPTYPDFGLNTGQVIPRVFTSTPTTPYKVGDIWTAGPANDIKRCSMARTSGAYQAGDWELASKYDKTSENTAADAAAYTGASIAVGNTDAKCTDASADETAAHTANNTTYANETEVQSTHDFKIKGTAEITPESASHNSLEFKNAAGAAAAQIQSGGATYGFYLLSASGKGIQISAPVSTDIYLSTGDDIKILASKFRPTINDNTSNGDATHKWSDVWTVVQHTGDIAFSDTHCPICKKRFKNGDNLIMKVIEINKDGETVTIPAHSECVL